MLKAYQQLEDSAKRTNLFAKFSSKIKSFARKSNFVQRISKTFDPEAFLLSLMNCVQSGLGSFSDIAKAYKEQNQGVSLSEQAIHERINRSEMAVENFLTHCISDICHSKFITAEPEHKTTLEKHFKRILVEDSSSMKLPKSCADDFKAHGNAHGETAGVKVNFTFDLLTGEPVESTLHSATQQDRTIAWDVLADLKPDDLVLRDMGYFDVSIFAEIDASGAYWLSRLTASANVRVLDSKKKSATTPLEKILKTTKLDQLDLAVEVTDYYYSCRLIAQRASRSEAAKKRKEIRARAKQKGKTPSKKALTRAGWHIMLTNIPASKLSITPLVKLYAQRWQIEIIFRGWKQSSNMQESIKRKSSPQHLKALILTGIIILLLSMKCWTILRRSLGEEGLRLSIEKIFSWFMLQVTRLQKLSDIAKLKPDIRHISSQKRKCKSLTENIIEI